MVCVPGCGLAAPHWGPFTDYTVAPDESCSWSCDWCKCQITHFYLLQIFPKVFCSGLCSSLSEVCKGVDFMVETVETHWFIRETMATATSRNMVTDSFSGAVHAMFFCPFVTINFLIKNVYFSPLGKYLQIITTERQPQYLFLPWRGQILFFFFFLWHHIRHPWGRGLTHSPWEIRINFQVGRAETKNDSFCLPLKLWSRHLLIFIDADPAQPSLFPASPRPPFLSGSPAPFAALNNARRFNASYVERAMMWDSKRVVHHQLRVLSSPRRATNFSWAKTSKSPHKMSKQIKFCRNDPKD